MKRVFAIGLAVAGLLASVTLTGFYKQPSVLKQPEFIPAKQGGNPVEARRSVSDFNWVNIGPNNLGGRTRAICYDPNGYSVWAGAIGGGLFRSDDYGRNWFRQNQFDGNLAISSIAIDSDGTMYIGTGELVFNRQAFYTQASPSGIDDFRLQVMNSVGLPGRGVYVSTDGGQTFSNMNSTWGNVPQADVYLSSNPFTSVQKVVAQNGRVFAATLNGLFFSDDKFATKTQSNGISGEIQDVEFGSGDVVYACTASGVFISTDKGANFSRVDNNRIERTANNENIYGPRIELATSVTGDTAYFMTVGNNKAMRGVWRKRTADTLWVRIGANSVDVFSPLGSAGAGTANGGYAAALAVDPKDGSRVLVGGQELWEYTPATNWTKIGQNYPGSFNLFPNYVPHNIHTIVFNPKIRNSFLIGTDREIIRSDNNGASFSQSCDGYIAAQIFNLDINTKGKLFAWGSQVGLIQNENPLSVPNFSRIFSTNNGVYNNVGDVAFSLFNPDNSIHTDFLGYNVLRSFNGSSFEKFFEVPNTCVLNQDVVFVESGGNRTIPNGSGNPYIPFVLDEIVQDTSLVDTATNRLNKKNKTYLFICTNSHFWTVTNPFGLTDSLPKWNQMVKNLIR
ncbi:MAG: hypothetical protein NZ108_07365, partial [Bacteroidia bacterium]|nr:hypothetical protein [Bacteroidia bacterium]